MDPQLVERIASNSIFAALFIWLLFYVLKQSEKREKWLAGSLEKLTELYQRLSGQVAGIEDQLDKKE